MTIKDSHVTIMVKVMDRSILFYQSIGFMLKNRWENHYAQLAAPGIMIGLHPAGKDNLSTSPGHISLGFTTDDFEKTKTQLNALSIAVTARNEEGGEFLHFNDPDGTELYFIKPK